DEKAVLDRLVNRAVVAVVDRVASVESLRRVAEWFEAGGGVEVSDAMAAEEYQEGLRGIPGLREAIANLGAFESPALVAAAIEFLLEGLHLHQKLNKDLDGGRASFRA
ncbi:MAG: magnesium chelatase, partial [Alphaproteobacteria bacterium]